MAKGHIRESLSPCAVPVLLVPKKDEHIRGDQLTDALGAAPPAAAPAEGGAPPAAATEKRKPAAKPTPPAKTTVTAEAIAAKVVAIREAAWRAALVAAAEGDPAFGDTFAAVLRGTWQVDAAFLGKFGRDELRFIAKEAGLIKHMGERKFAKLLEAKVPDIIAGMLNATDFTWAGRLPGAMTLDGKYGAPPAAPAPTPEQKD